MTYRIGFVMAQVAGHVTHARNLRRVVASNDRIDATWCEIAYHRDGGSIERMADIVGRGMALRPLVELRRELRGRRFDAMLVNTSAADVHQRPFLSTPTMVDFDATPLQLSRMPEYGRSLGSRPVASVRRHRKARLWNGVERLQAWSAWAKASAVEDYGVDPDRILVNPPGVDLALWSPGPIERSERPGPSRILFVGGDFERKGGDVLLEWYRRARPRDVELHLVTRDPVEATTGVTVHADVTPNSARLVELYRSCDVFVLPSRAECFGIATVEAMATGLPVVVTDAGASGEIVQHGRNGYVVGAGRSDELGDAVSHVLRDRGGCMGVASRAIAMERFRLETNADRTFAELERLAAPGGAP